MRAKLAKVLRFLKSYISVPMPETDEGLQALIADVAEMAGFPANDSIQFAVATMILHAKDGTYKASKRSFVIQLKRAASNQAAGNLMHILKDRQREQSEQRAKEASGQMVQEIS
jgi:hypothetical protein